ncbi:hypothetical protein BGX34_003494, partial [Mortierella sp. NVP85]
TESSDGWSVLSTTGRGKVSLLDCGVPAYGGSTMVFFGGYYANTPARLPDSDWRSAIYTLDVVKRTWKQGPPAPKGFISSGCAVSGDQFITSGYMEPRKVNDPGRTLVFNMKTEKWVSKYVAPPLSQTPTQNTTSELGETSSNTKRLAITIVTVTGCLLAIIVGLFVYRRRTRQSDLSGPSMGSLDIKDNINAPEKGIPLGSSHARLHEGAFGAQLVSEHPHAIVEDPTMNRGVQEGALAIQILPQYPHIMVDKQELTFQVPQHPHAIGKEELEDE